MAEHSWGTVRHLNIDDLEHTPPEEVEAFLSWTRRNFVPTYFMTSHTVWLENRPDALKLHYRVLPHFGKDFVDTLFVMSIGQLGVYIALDWEIGITNEFKVLQEQGVTKAQLMEAVMAAQLYSGVRGMEGVYRATWSFIRDFRDRPEPAKFPEGWGPDMPAFKTGMDTTTVEYTARDRELFRGWYQKNHIDLPKWMQFLEKHNPRFLKAYRLRWEGSFRGALPKQVMPYMMMYFNVYYGDRDGIREAVQLAIAWGLDKQLILLALYGAAYYYTGMERLNLVSDAVGDLLD